MKTLIWSLSCLILVACATAVTQRRISPVLVEPVDYEFDDLAATDCWWDPNHVHTGACDGETIRFPAYPGAPTSLREVRVYYRWHISYDFKAENLHSDFAFNTLPPLYAGPNYGEFNPINGLPWNYTLYSWMWAKNEVNYWVPLHELPSIQIHQCRVGQLEPFDGLIDFLPPSGVTTYVEWDQCLQPNYWTASVSVVTSPIHFPAFLDADGDGMVEWTFRGGSFVNVEAPLGEAGLNNYLTFLWDLRIDKVEYITQ